MSNDNRRAERIPRRSCSGCAYAFYPDDYPSPMRCCLNPPTVLMCHTEDGIEVKSLHPAVRQDWFCQHFTDLGETK